MYDCSWSHQRINQVLCPLNTWFLAEKFDKCSVSKYPTWGTRARCLIQSKRSWVHMIAPNAFRNMNRPYFLCHLDWWSNRAVWSFTFFVISIHAFYKIRHFGNGNESQSKFGSHFYLKISIRCKKAPSNHQYVNWLDLWQLAAGLIDIQGNAF